MGNSVSDLSLTKENITKSNNSNIIKFEKKIEDIIDDEIFNKILDISNEIFEEYNNLFLNEDFCSNFAFIYEKKLFNLDIKLLKNLYNEVNSNKIDNELTLMLQYIPQNNEKFIDYNNFFKDNLVENFWYKNVKINGALLKNKDKKEVEKIIASTKFYPKYIEKEHVNKLLEEINNINENSDKLINKVGGYIKNNISHKMSLKNIPNNNVEYNNNYENGDAITSNSAYNLDKSNSKNKSTNANNSASNSKNTSTNLDKSKNISANSNNSLSNSKNTSSNLDKSKNISANSSNSASNSKNTSSNLDKSKNISANSNNSASNLDKSNSKKKTANVSNSASNSKNTSTNSDKFNSKNISNNSDNKITNFQKKQLEQKTNLIIAKNTFLNKDIKPSFIENKTINKLIKYSVPKNFQITPFCKNQYKCNLSKKELCQAISENLIIKNNIIAAILTIIPYKNKEGEYEGGLCYKMFLNLDSCKVCLPDNYRSLIGEKFKDILPNILEKADYLDKKICKDKDGIFYELTNEQKEILVKKIKNITVKELKNNPNIQYNLFYAELKSKLRNIYFENLNFLIEILEELRSKLIFSNKILNEISNKTKKIIDNTYTMCQYYYIHAIYSIINLDVKEERKRNTQIDPNLYNAALPK